MPANIAEGRSRRGKREFARFLAIAYGSLAELETHIQLAERLGYVDASRTQPILAYSAEVGRMLNGLGSTLAAQDKKHRKPSSRRPVSPPDS